MFDAEFHRGGRDARPENTLYSYQYALENGASTIECDMQLTADGEIVMSHNPELNPDITVGRDGKRVRAGLLINRMTLEEVQSYNVGRMDPASEYCRLHGRTQIQADARIPTLRELFRLVRDSGNPTIRMNIETKSYPDPAMGRLYEQNSDMDAMLAAFHGLVKEFGFERRVYLQSFDWSTLLKMKRMEPAVETIALYCEEKSWGSPDATTLWTDRDAPSPWLGGADIRDYQGDPVRAAHALGIDHVSPYYGGVTEEAVREAHAFGMKVIPWTVNEPEDMARMMDMGVDGIISDRPWVLRAFLAARGIALPAPCRLELPYHLDGDHREADTVSSPDTARR